MTRLYLNGMMQEKSILVEIMFSQLKDIASSALSTASERVRNPVLGALVFSWCSFNWKPLLFLLFSNESIEIKINYISNNSDIVHSVVYPILCTFFLCIVVPWFNNIVAVFQKMPLQNIDNFNHNKSIRDVKNGIELRRLEAQRDMTYERVKVEFDSEIQFFKNDLFKHQAAIDSFLTERDELNKKILQLERELQLEKIKSSSNRKISARVLARRQTES
ncbi:TPA: hypothetical protein ACJIK4_004445 [Kluyvera cryocrescens]